MTAEEMWKASGLMGEYDAWSFGDNSDNLAELVKNGLKTATSSAYALYENEELPHEGEYSVVLNSKEKAVCIIKTTRVYTSTFDEVTERHAYKEGEGDRSLEYWKQIHKEFFIKQLKKINQEFSGKMKLVCEEFELVWK